MQVCSAPPFSAAEAAAGDVRWRPHDVLQLARLTALDGEPGWVRAAFLAAPYAVVRRAQAAAGFVAVGIRGATRSHRYGTWVAAGDVACAFAPEALAVREPAGPRGLLPAFVALATLRSAPGVLAPFAWGPAGSAGFELATQLPTVGVSSDLDLLIRTPDRLTVSAAQALLAELQMHAQRAQTRVDAQLETPVGGVALAEFATGKPHVMARTARGPRLVSDPWASATEPA
ncbi:MAG TPA: malonate decarboxylase holo-ACP synthase [Paraburkholderia sp.]|jgi:phosphoribosyl-dephospho-CoA transferase|nr:malonate decarboxylase holo-ACP synthase [Paraburkholderia sp.]